MLRVIFDTNIYGLLLKELDREKIEERISADKEFVEKLLRKHKILG